MAVFGGFEAALKINCFGFLKQLPNQIFLSFIYLFIKIWGGDTLYNSTGITTLPVRPCQLYLSSGKKRCIGTGVTIQLVKLQQK
jgi:hypothetical protein